jgi:uncharacterized protein YktA (UPF0223 family)
MSSPLVQIDELCDLIRQLHKIDSKLQAGQFIAAYRENRRIIASLEENKKKLIESQEESKTNK